MRGLVALYGAAVAALLAAALHSVLTDSPPWLFTRDPAAIHLAHPLFGALSNLGAVLWAAAASIALFTAMLLPRTSGGAVRSYLLNAGVLTAWLMLDDLYMLHERVLPDFLGIPQPLVFGAYVLLVALLIVRFRRVIIGATDYRLLALALAFFALSIASDQGPGEWHQLRWLILVEDGAKLLGIVSWLAYFASIASRALASRLTDRA